MQRTDWDRECDILVVGSGAGGLTAAAVAADHHGQVIVVEKGPRFGGTSASSGAVLWIPLSHLWAEAGQQDDADQVFNYIKSIAGDDCSEELIHAFLAQGPEMLNYMQHREHVAYQTIPFPDYRADLPGGAAVGRTHECLPLDGRLLGEDFDKLELPASSNMLFGRWAWAVSEANMLVTRAPGWLGAFARMLWRYYTDIPQRFKSRRQRYLTCGNALIGRLKLSLDKRGVPLWLNAGLVELKRDGDEGIVGAVVERDGRRVTIGVRKGVILATGGFERNAELRAKYMPQSADPEWSGGHVHNTGDALGVAGAVGAAAARLDSAWRAPALHVPGEDRARPLFVERALPGNIIVNQAAQRFMNEAVDYHTAAGAMIENDKPGAGTSPSFILFDAHYLSRYAMGPVMPILPLWIQPAGARKILHRAMSWQELAQKIGVDAQALTATMAHFNSNARIGRDPDFHRGEGAIQNHYGDSKVQKNRSLAPLDKAPFYALAIYPGDIGTNGGLVTDVNGAVLDTDGRAIPNLYAAGNVTASAMGRGYPGGGATIGAAMTFAYVAARHAMGVE